MSELVKVKTPDITLQEKLLLPIAAIIAILWNRLVYSTVFFADTHTDSSMAAAAFWLCYIVAFHAFYWKKAVKSVYSRLLACGAAALCLWNFLFTQSYERGANNSFGGLTYFVIPAILMAHAQFVAYDLGSKDALQTAVSWIFGWIVKPFSGLPALAGATNAVFFRKIKPIFKKIAVGAVITIPLLIIIIQLLSGADVVFKYYVNQVVSSWGNSSLPWHIAVTLIAFALFYSFLWNIGFGGNERLPYRFDYKADSVVCCVILAAVSAVYALFCAIQFAYLFARLGLPGGMTYSAYAREGFAQTVAVCAINLVIFGITLTVCGESKVVKGFLAILLGFTGVMLVSGVARLKLYIDVYGLTWLRVLSAWFVIYLAAVIALCAARLIRKRFPVSAVCAVLLLAWYVALGYSNPDQWILSYNQSRAQASSYSGASSASAASAVSAVTAVSTGFDDYVCNGD